MATDPHQMNYLIRRRKKAKDYLGGQCAVCGTTDKLEFDHINPTSKVSAISEAIAGHWSWERLEVELDKCQLLCQYHHIEKTKAEGSNTGGGRNRINNPEHGTSVMYGREGCRCDLCGEWRRLYKNGLVDSLGARLGEGSAPIVC